MKKFPESETALVIRTDFSNDQQWEDLKAKISAPVGGFKAVVEFIDDKAYEALKSDKIKSCLAKDSELEFVFLVDKETFANPDHLIACVDLLEKIGDTIRVIPTEMWNVENNLTLANMEFADFKGAVDENNIFRGFK